MARQLPGPVEMRWPSLRWAMSQRGYLGVELKAHLATLFELTADELALTSPEGVSVFSNNVDWVTAHFTEMGIHTSVDGRDHAGPDDPYYLTRYGYAIGEGRVRWPAVRRHGPRGTLPDPRQLPRAAEGRAA
jgi:hypothetical protein